MKRTVLSFVVILLLIPAISNAQGSITVGLGFDRRPASVIYIPQDLRIVPTHKDDGTVRQRTIPHETIDIPAQTLFTLSMGPQWRMGFLKLRGGLNLAFDIKSGSEPLTGGIIEWGQFANNDSRGTGTSLVYVKVLTPQVAWGPYAEAEVGSNRIGIIGGYSRMMSKLKYENGWDRYNEFEVRESLDGINSRSQLYIGGQISPYASELVGIAIRVVGGMTEDTHYQIGQSYISRIWQTNKFLSINCLLRFGG
jgi:hypothetical protein